MVRQQRGHIDLSSEEAAAAALAGGGGGSAKAAANAADIVGVEAVDPQDEGALA